MKCEATHLGEVTMVYGIKKINLFDFIIKLMYFLILYLFFINLIYWWFIIN